MIGAIAGDVIGSIYEPRPIKTREFPLFHPECCFTDDSVMTIAIAKAILTGTPYQTCVRELGRKYPAAGYGGSFRNWLDTRTPQPYNSWGNGSAMRVSPIGFAFESEQEVLDQAKLSAEFTHNHPEGIKGAQATALAIFLARKGSPKEAIRQQIQTMFDYDLDRTVDSIRPGYLFEISCQKSVPESILCFLEADSYEGAVRNAISLGGDSDTMACIAGGIAEAYYGEIPIEIQKWVKTKLTAELWEITEEFEKKYGLKA